MPEETPNHGLNKYQLGATDWTHAPDMQHIEERLVVRDLEENLGNYEPHSVATFIATDTGATYDGDGTSWNPATREVGSFATDDLNNIPQFTDGDDKATDIQDELDAQHDAIGTDYRGGEVKIDGGIYGVGTMLRLRNRQALRGAGIDKTDLVATAALDSIIEYHNDNADPANDRMFFAEVTGMSVNADNQAVRCVYTHGTQANDFHIEKVFARNATGHGVELDSPFGAHVTSLVSEFHAGDGLHLNGATQGHAASVFSSYNDGRGVYSNTNETSFRGINTRNNGAAGVLIHGDGQNLFGVFTRNNDGPGLRLAGADQRGHTAMGVVAFENNDLGLDIAADGSAVSGFITSANTTRGCRVGGDNVRLSTGYLDDDLRIISSGVTATNIHVDGTVFIGSGAQDTDLRSINGSATISDSGTRTRWDGVIGGGPLGGVDLGSTTGQFVGDKALADGTTGAAWIEAVWTGSEWQQADGSATITPA